MMNKLLAILSVMFVVSLISVSAYTPFGGSSKYYKSFNLVKKDPTDWSVLPGANANLQISEYTGCYWQRVGLRTMKVFQTKTFFVGSAQMLVPNTDYTLIYYGDATHNDVWNYATCISQGRSNQIGQLSIYGQYDGKMLNNGVDQKIWLVKSSDVDCVQGKMTAWNPEEYLFERNTI